MGRSGYRTGLHGTCLRGPDPCPTPRARSSLTKRAHAVLRCEVGGAGLPGRLARQTCSPACRRERSRRRASARQEALLGEVVTWLDRLVADGLALRARLLDG